MSLLCDSIAKKLEAVLIGLWSVLHVQTYRRELLEISQKTAGNFGFF